MCSWRVPSGKSEAPDARRQPASGYVVVVGVTVYLEPELQLPHIILALSLLFFLATPAACGRSWARDQIRATAAISARSLTHCARLGMEPVPSQRQHQIFNSLHQWELVLVNSRCLCQRAPRVASMSRFSSFLTRLPRQPLLSPSCICSDSSFAAATPPPCTQS